MGSTLCCLILCAVTYTVVKSVEERFLPKQQCCVSWLSAGNTSDTGLELLWLK